VPITVVSSSIFGLKESSSFSQTGSSSSSEEPSPENSGSDSSSASESLTIPSLSFTILGFFSFYTLT